MPQGCFESIEKPLSMLDTSKNGSLSATVTDKFKSSTNSGPSLDVIDLIRKLNPFHLAPDQFFIDIGPRLSLWHVAPYRNIISKGDKSDNVYWIVDGSVVVTSDNGRKIVATLGPGSFFGEIGVLFGLSRTADVVAANKCLIISLTSDILFEISSLFPFIYSAIRKEAHSRLWSCERLTPTMKSKKRKLEIMTGTHKFLMYNSLSKISLLESLPEDILRKLSCFARRKLYEPLEYIIEQNTKNKEIYFIVEGTIQVLNESSNWCIVTLEKGSYFGGYGFLASTNRAVSVRALTNLECVVLSEQIVTMFCNIHPCFNRHIQKAVSIPSKDDKCNNAYIRNRTSCQRSKRCKRLYETNPQNYYLACGSDNNGFYAYSLSSASSVIPVTISSIRHPNNLFYESPNYNPGPVDTNDQKVLHVQFPHFSLSIEEDNNLFNLSKKLYQNKNSLRFLNRGPFSDAVLLEIFQYLLPPQLKKLQQVCQHWRQLVNSRKEIAHNFNISSYNTIINDTSINLLAEFVGSRACYVDISNCFHVTDIGFECLLDNFRYSPIRSFAMKSVWSVSASSIIGISHTAMKDTLEHIQLTNCRNVTDNVIIQLLGWTELCVNKEQPKVIGCRNLKRLGLNYCKSITDRTMYHISRFVNDRIESLSISRCTNITDQGFLHWAHSNFPKLTNLDLSDCTFLTDNSIRAITKTCQNLTELNLSFCCSLTGISVELISEGCRKLRHLNLAYCGSAVSDKSLYYVGSRLFDLETLSIRGCILVTNRGIFAVTQGCQKLTSLNATQCKNVGQQRK